MSIAAKPSESRYGAVTEEEMLAWFESEEARERGTKLGEDVPLSCPQVVAVLPFTVVARLSRRRWGVYLSKMETPDARALLACPPDHLDRSKEAAMRTAGQCGRRNAVVQPLVNDFARLIDEHNHRIPAAVFGEWLRTMAVALGERCAALRADFGDGVPNEFELLGQFASIAFEQAVVR